ncbi:MAG: DNA pilot protein [Microviridae sp.]|nr:MAG: DNA pilot protein [Microviridae sp.]
MVAPLMGAAVGAGASAGASAGLGSLLGSAGSFLGGLSSIGGLFKKSGPSLKSLNKQAEVQYNWQRKLNQTALQDKVADANAAGIHPLYAISGQTNQGGISMPSGDAPDNDRFERMGQNIERAVTAYSTKNDRALMQKSTMLDLERKGLENEVLRNQAAGSRLALQTQAGQPPANQSVSGTKSKLEEMGTPLGSEDGIVPMHVMGYDEDMNPIRVFNQKLGDNDTLQALHALRYTLPDYIQGGIRNYKKKYIKKGTFFNK